MSSRCESPKQVLFISAIAAMIQLLFNSDIVKNGIHTVDLSQRFLGGTASQDWNSSACSKRTSWGQLLNIALMMGIVALTICIQQKTAGPEGFSYNLTALIAGLTYLVLNNEWMARKGPAVLFDGTGTSCLAPTWLGILVFASLFAAIMRLILEMACS
jgi:hypothetical protein